MKIRESVYYAAFEDFSMDVLTNNPQFTLDPALQQMMMARRSLLNGNLNRALNVTNEVINLRPDLLEANLLKIDILYAQGQYDEAANLLVELQAQENLPEWIRAASTIEAQ